MQIDDALYDLAKASIERAHQQSLQLVTAESCTGGLIAGVISAVAGSSSILQGGLVTYSNAMKQDLLHVPEHLIKVHGAVSEPVALAMALGALTACPTANFSLSVTGVAGPGQTEEKLAGLVYIAFMNRGQQAKVQKHDFAGQTRDGVRHHTIKAALNIICHHA